MCVFSPQFTLVGFGKACGPSEYKSAAGECCPMCDSGSVVGRDCSGDLSTTCKPCAPGTFISEPNGLHKCLACRNCAESQGLYILSKCTRKENTVCDVLDGYHCIDYSNTQCSHAQKHSVCKPGQEIKTPGTNKSDTVCVECAPGFYSPSGLSCTKWTGNEIQTENGSSVKNGTSTAKRGGRYGLIVAVVFTIFPLIFIIQSTRNKLKFPVAESTSTNTAQICKKLEENNED
ncbi:si:ch211-261n11.8 [Pseudorasbora parva]|uniref:si:ch211-261n11.8 n=1 Tax=Pseudorasbora parva TaxID=51549 RepID=UPI00351DA9F4